MSLPTPIRSPGFISTEMSRKTVGPSLGKCKIHKVDDLERKITGEYRADSFSILISPEEGQ